MPTIKLILDERRMKIKSGKFPVKLRVTFKRVTRDYQTIYDLSSEDFKKLTAPRISHELHLIRDRLKEIHRTAENSIEEFQNFDFNKFEVQFILNNSLFKERKIKEKSIATEGFQYDFAPYYKKFPIFNEEHSNPGTISPIYLSYIKKLIQEERIGNALNYKDSYSSIKKFKGNVLFAEITVSFLNQYEHWMKNRDCAAATIGIKLRALRSIFNEAIEQGVIKRDAYPFGKRKYQIPTGKNIKKALHQNSLKEIYFYKSKSEDEKKAKDFWLFCYLANGMNPKDVAYLKYKDIKGEYIEFVRAKTERTTRKDPKRVTVYLSEDLKDIIQRWGNDKRHSDNYIFPILTPNLSALKRHEIISAFIQFINHRMKRIGKELGIDHSLTTIVSRHSFSTQLKRSGASTEFIQEALGHSNKQTTENYLGSFENEVKKHFASKLLAFKNE
jgi:integrase/recombinase XerD